MGFVNIHGQRLDLADQIHEGMRQRYLMRKAMLHEPRKPTVKNGYAAPPGTGPAGEICKGCVHKLSMVSNGGTKRFIKCELRRATWTHGEGSDILASSPACSKWTKLE